MVSPCCPVLHLQPVVVKSCETAAATCHRPAACSSTCVWGEVAWLRVVELFLPNQNTWELLRCCDVSERLVSMHREFAGPDVATEHRVCSVVRL